MCTVLAAYMLYWLLSYCWHALLADAQVSLQEDRGRAECAKHHRFRAAWHSDRGRALRLDSPEEELLYCAGISKTWAGWWWGWGDRKTSIRENAASKPHVHWWSFVLSLSRALSPPFPPLSLTLSLWLFLTHSLSLSLSLSLSSLHFTRRYNLTSNKQTNSTQGDLGWGS